MDELQLTRRKTNPSEMKTRIIFLLSSELSGLLSR
jgi:hypothetical protein